MERYPHYTLDDGLIALIIANLDHQVGIRGGKDIHNPVDLIIEVAIDLAEGTMQFTLASKLSYSVLYTFKQLEASQVLKLLLGSNVVFFGGTDMIKAQLESGSFHTDLVYYDGTSVRGSRKIAVRR